MPRDLHPSDGARYLLERDGEPEAAPEPGVIRARYRATIYTPDAAFTAAVVLDDAGGAEVAASGAPDALHARLVGLARLVARDSARLRDDGMPPWPQRILRWRR